jgi:hypothetical protein
MREGWVVWVALAAAACGSSGNPNVFEGGDGGSDATASSGSGSSGAGGDGGGSSSGAGSSGGDGGPSFGDGAVADGGSCTPPDMLIVLDHTDSMSATPQGSKPANTPAGHATSKWYLATQAVKAAVAPPLDQKVAYGLELFPLDPKVVPDAGGTGTCRTLTELLGGTASNNTQCMGGEIPVAPAVGTGNTITTLLDPETLALCVSTPIALALGTAQAELAGLAQANVGQYVLLVTDGGETCKGDVVGITQKLATAGVKTFVVGFGSADAGAAGVNVKLLDDVACAGMTATGFPAPCTKGASGYTATSTSGPPLFYLAEDGAALQTALQSITSKICCGCAQ